MYSCSKDQKTKTHKTFPNKIPMCNKLSIIIRTGNSYTIVTYKNMWWLGEVRFMEL